MMVEVFAIVLLGICIFLAIIMIKNRVKITKILQLEFLAMISVIFLFLIIKNNRASELSSASLTERDTLNRLYASLHETSNKLTEKGLFGKEILPENYALIAEGGSAYYACLNVCCKRY